MNEIGLNNKGMAYEVALEILGQSRQPYMQAIIDEKAKATPSTPLIDYCKMRLSSIDRLQETLMPDDMDTVRRILEKEAPFKTL